jgi:hypothetical protein
MFVLRLCPPSALCSVSDSVGRETEFVREMSAITGLQLTSSPTNSDADYRRVEVKGTSEGKIAGAFFLWIRRGGSDEPITDLRVAHGEAAPADGMVKLPQNLAGAGASSAAKPVFIWYTSKGPGSPIIDLKVILADDMAGPGFSRIAEELNPEVPAAQKEFLVYKTKAAQAKLDQKDFKVGDMLDVCDCVNQWVVARVVELDAAGDRIKIHVRSRLCQATRRAARWCIASAADVVFFSVGVVCRCCSSVCAVVYEV